MAILEYKNNTGNRLKQTHVRWKLPMVSLKDTQRDVYIDEIQGRKVYLGSQLKSAVHLGGRRVAAGA